MLPQSDTERLLEDRLLRLGVPVERSTEVPALRIGADGAEATLRRADGKEEVIHADWPRRMRRGAQHRAPHARSSFLRRNAGQRLDPGRRSYEGISFPRHRGRRLLGARGGAPDLPDLARALSHHCQRPAGGEDHPRDPTLEDVQAIVEQRGPKGVSLFDPLWLSSFRINSRKVAAIRQGACS